MRSNAPATAANGGKRTGSSNGTAHKSLAVSHVGEGSGGVAAIQRARLIAAITEIVAERGFSCAVVAQVVSRAGVSRRTFYELFEDREACFLAALDTAIAEAAERIDAAHEPGGQWRERIRSGLIALLGFLEECPNTGRLLMVESLGAGLNALECRNNALTRVVAVVDEGRRERKGVDGTPPFAAEGVVGGAISIVHGRIVSRDPRPLVELTNPLMSMIVLPYLGAAAARKELGLPLPPPSASRAPQMRGNPLGALQIRLTYRTVRALSAVAANPGSSNRHLAEVSEIVDQGQMSKLLGRLEKFGLIENDGLEAVRGGPNAWRLTRHGEEVQDALTVRV